MIRRVFKESRCSIVRQLLVILIAFTAIGCQSNESKEEARAHDFINYIIETKACPHLDQPILLIEPSRDKQAFSPMYSSIMERWFSKENLKLLEKQHEKFKGVKLDSNLILTKRLGNHAEIREANMSYSYLSYPLFNNTNDVCLIIAGYKVHGLVAGSAIYIFKKVALTWNKVEVFGISLS